MTRAGVGPEPVAVVYPDNLAALGVCRALGAHGVPVTVVSADHSSPGQYSRYGRRLSCPPGADGTALAEFLVEFSRRQHHMPVIFLTDDASLVTINRERAWLEPWYHFPQSPWPVLAQLLLKDRLYGALEGVVPVPRTRLPAEGNLDEVARDLGLPVVVKPVLRCLADGASSGVPFEKVFGSKALRATTPAELRRAYRAARAHGFTVLVQEEIPGPISALYSVGLYASRTGQVVAAFTSQKLGQVPPDFGDGLVVQAVEAPELVAAAAAVVRHFGYHGIADIEFKRDPRDGRYKLLDVNPRPWLWINLPTACGVNLAWAAYLDALDRPLDPAAFVQRDFGTRWVSSRGLLVHLVRSALRGRRPEGLLETVRRCRGRRVGPLFSREDLLVRMFVSPAYWRDFFRQLPASLYYAGAARPGR